MKSIYSLHLRNILGQLSILFQILRSQILPNPQWIKIIIVETKFRKRSLPFLSYFVFAWIKNIFINFGFYFKAFKYRLSFFSISYKVKPKEKKTTWKSMKYFSHSRFNRNIVIWKLISYIFRCKFNQSEANTVGLV
jgi:hypothetical protein